MQCRALRSPFVPVAFLAILVPVIVGALAVSNRASLVAERSALAGELGENKLNELQLNDAWTAADIDRMRAACSS